MFEDKFSTLFFIMTIYILWYYIRLEPLAWASFKYPHFLGCELHFTYANKNHDNPELFTLEKEKLPPIIVLFKYSILMDVSCTLIMQFIKIMEPTRPSVFQKAGKDFWSEIQNYPKKPLANNSILQVFIFWKQLQFTLYSNKP